MHLFVSQLICTSIHHLTANNVSCYIMTSFHSCLTVFQTPSTVEQFFCKATSIKCSKNIYTKSALTKKDSQSDRQNCILFLRQSFISSIFLSLRDNSCYKTAGIKSNFIRKVSSCTIIGLLFISNSIIV